MSRYPQIFIVCIVAGMLLPLSVSGRQASDSREVELLWSDGAPVAKGDGAGDKPKLTIYLPPKQKATGAAVVICPGGGYGHLA
ncbi:MAG: hypothetical protein ACYS8Z_19475, partial [Planctomycetota bacterium]